MISFLTIIMLHFLAVISPGPDFAIVVKNSLIYSRRYAVYTALGITIGIIFHLSYCVLGLALIISQSAAMFKIIKLLGASYLIYIGIKSLISKQGSSTLLAAQESIPQPPTSKGFFEGFWCNVLNPKCTLFFLSLFTLVIDPATPKSIQLLYCIAMIIVTFIWFSLLALMITSKKFKSKLHKAQNYLNKFMGVALILFGIKLAFTTQ